MKRTKQKPKKPTVDRHPLIIVSIILVILLAGFAVYWFLIRTANDQTAISDNPTASKITNSADSPSENTTPVENNSSDSRDPYNQTPAQYEGDDANTYNNLTGAINYSGVAGDELLIYTTIDQTVTGKCKLTLKNGDQTVTKENDIITNPSSSACDTFRVKTSELGSGTWSITINLQSSNKTGTITGEVKI